MVSYGPQEKGLLLEFCIKAHRVQSAPSVYLKKVLTTKMLMSLAILIAQKMQQLLGKPAFRY